MNNSKNNINFRLALGFQLSYLGMSIFWNLINVGLTLAEQQPLGPAGSLEIVSFLVLMAIALMFGARHSLSLYAGISLVLGIASLWTIYGAFTGEVSNWISPFFRVFGALINVVGIVGLLLACSIFYFNTKKIGTLCKKAPPPVGGQGFS